MHHLLRIYFKLCPNDNYFNSGEKIKKINLCQENFREDVVKIRSLSKLIGNLVAASPAVTLCPFNCRALEENTAKNRPTETMIL